MRTGKVQAPELELDRKERQRKEHEELLKSLPPGMPETVPAGRVCATENVPSPAPSRRVRLSSIAETPVGPAMSRLERNVAPAGLGCLPEADTPSAESF